MSRDTSAASFATRLSALLRYDVPASVVVFLVALPLSIGIAVASGAPVMAGLIAAIVGGIVAGLVGGAPLQVSGPTAGNTVVIAGLIQNFGWKVTCLVTVGAGVLQIMFGLSRIARAALAIAPVVVHAMLAGLGITIALQQVHVALGGQSGPSAVDNLSRLPSQIAALHWRDLLLAGVVVVILVGWRSLPKRLRLVPAPLVAVLLATLASLPMAVQRIELQGSLFDAISLPALPDGQWATVGAGMVTIALIASVESLLSAVAVDKMHAGERTNFDRELIGQGTANVTSGMLGGLPVTAVIVRSATNVTAGARSRASTVLHGMWILVFTVALAGLVQQVPKAVLAGLLIVVGVQLIKLAHIQLAHRTGDLLIYIATAAGVVLANLLEAMVIGLALALALLFWRVARATVKAAPDGDAWRLTVDGTCTFLAVPRLAKAVAAIPAGARVAVDLTVDFLDHAAHEALSAWAARHEGGGGTVEFAGALPGPQPPLRSAFTPARGAGPGSATARHQLFRHRTPVEGGPRTPKTLLLTCADLSAIPDTLMNSAPGNLFTIRNLGNLVPAGNGHSSVAAALEFALSEFSANRVVVCGHTDCAAMAELAAGQDLAGDWLRHAAPALECFSAGHPVAAAAAAAGYRVADQLAMVNVAVQLASLRAHPLVVAARDIEVTGLFLDGHAGHALEITDTGIAGYRRQDRKW